ncbi:hypothetical protein [Erysipelothrix anatis]|uniref:hypothetical protein n=1 Tax=Erysipelothrix anatis TaxID=2683713 RepID=UPI00135981CA|nr:hypothetical protein [Erysipelothrix anatis]
MDKIYVPYQFSYTLGKYSTSTLLNTYFTHQELEDMRETIAIFANSLSPVIDAISKSIETLSDAFLETSKSLIESIDPIVASINEMTTIISKIIRDFCKYVLPSFLALSLASVSYNDWILHNPSFINSEFDMTVPATGPPSTSSDLQTEKERFRSIGVFVFAALMITTGVSLAISYQIEIWSYVSAVMSSNPIVMLLISGGIGFLKWIIPEETNTKLKEKVRNFFKICKSYL